MTTANLQNAFDKQPNEVSELILTFLEYDDAARFRMTNKGFYSLLPMTLTEEHRNTIESYWGEIYHCCGIDRIKQILAQDEKIDPSINLYYEAYNQFDDRDEKGITEEKMTELFYFLWKDLDMNPSFYDDCAIKYASRYGCINLVRDLLKDGRVNPSAEDNYAFRFAWEKGHLNVVEELLNDEKLDPSAGDNCAIRFASAEGRLNVVEKLLKDDRVNPSA
eukprot:CAMPEP_0172483714 /NCGR_PEP_ID=MMETSP1066-20121228/10833_1 /TAXON_ID=671091 /ORGANISM="Coscinodiscus wailesii, Strain CCMP2513" /LENGTH=219 /DNA_ID=CAMNT_0013247771 /DNA_START=14 /DNA_END=670 /DNA_ORIENTATION=+